MPGPAVINASPLILLAKAGRLVLLRGLGRDVIVPDAVLQELRAKGADDPVFQSVQHVAWLRVAPDAATPASVAAWRLGAGESAVLTCALQYADPLAVLDDREGRRCAASHGVPVIGTVGVVLLGKDAGTIPLVAPVLEELVAAGMRASDALLARALDLAGEKPEPQR